MARNAGEMASEAPLTAEELQHLRPTPLSFEPPELRRALQGCEALYCTYWIRFESASDSFQAAAQRCKRLFEAARDAGVQRVVFTSHTHAAAASPFPYLAGKGAAVEALRDLGRSAERPRRGRYYICSAEHRLLYTTKSRSSTCS